MRFHNYGFIGKSHSLTTLSWAGQDNKDEFLRNFSKMPGIWYYKKTPITYRYNSLGHRSKEISSLNLENYILCVGCSNTEGIGVEEDKTYPYLLSKKLNCDFYNLGIGGTGIDVTLHNLVIWFSVVSTLPKALIIQWPDVTRTMTGTSDTTLHPRGMWSTDDSLYENFIDLAHQINFLAAKKMMADRIIRAIAANIPVIYFGMGKIIPFNEDTIIEPIIDYARDLSHPGIKSHARFAESIHDYLINTLCLSFCQNPEEKS